MPIFNFSKKSSDEKRAIARTEIDKALTELRKTEFWTKWGKSFDDKAVLQKNPHFVQIERRYKVYPMPVHVASELSKIFDDHIMLGRMLNFLDRTGEKTLKKELEDAYSDIIDSVALMIDGKEDFTTDAGREKFQKKIDRYYAAMLKSINAIKQHISELKSLDKISKQFLDVVGTTKTILDQTINNTPEIYDKIKQFINNSKTPEEAIDEIMLHVHSTDITEKEKMRTLNALRKIRTIWPEIDKKTVDEIGREGLLYVLEKYKNKLVSPKKVPPNTNFKNLLDIVSKMQLSDTEINVFLNKSVFPKIDISKLNDKEKEILKESVKTYLNGLNEMFRIYTGHYLESLALLYKMKTAIDSTFTKSLNLDQHIQDRLLRKKRIPNAVELSREFLRRINEASPINDDLSDLAQLFTLFYTFNKDKTRQILRALNDVHSGGVMAKIKANLPGGELKVTGDLFYEMRKRLQETNNKLQDFDKNMTQFSISIT